jgi:glutathione S-transferase
MSLTLYFHPLSSFCQKALIALYENDTPFTPLLTDLGEEASRAALLKLWPIGKFPVLRDDARDETVPEATIIVEYLAAHYPGKIKLIPDDPAQAWRVRLADRFYDLYVNEMMQKIVGDRLRPAGSKDPFGVEQAKSRLKTVYDMVEKDMTGKTWAVGENYTMADCAASPALFYANKVLPFESTHRNVARYFERLSARPSFRRALDEAKPYFKFFPEE